MTKAKPAYLELREACAEVVRVMRAGEPLTVREYELCKEAGEHAEKEARAALEPSPPAIKRLRKLIADLQELPMGVAGYYHATEPPYHRDPLPLAIHGLKLTLAKMLEKQETKQ